MIAATHSPHPESTYEYITVCSTFLLKLLLAITFHRIIATVLQLLCAEYTSVIQGTEKKQDSCRICREHSVKWLYIWNQLLILYPVSAIISGATYVGVPHTVYKGPSTTVASPKSPSFNDLLPSWCSYTYKRKIGCVSKQIYVCIGQISEFVGKCHAS